MSFTPSHKSVLRSSTVTCWTVRRALHHRVKVLTCMRFHSSSWLLSNEERAESTDARNMHAAIAQFSLRVRLHLYIVSICSVYATALKCLSVSVALYLYSSRDWQRSRDPSERADRDIHTSKGVARGGSLGVDHRNIYTALRR